MKNRKIKFYKERTFSEKFDDTIAFIRQNFRILIKYSCYTLLPFALLAGFGLNTLMDFSTTVERVADASLDPEIIFQLLGSMACIFPLYIGILLFTDVVYSLMQVYNNRENGLENVEWDDIKPYFTKNIGKLIILGIVAVIIAIIIILVIVLLAVAEISTLFLTIPVFFVYLICQMQWSTVYIYEERGVFDALATGLRYGWNTFGGMLALGIVINIISNIIGSVISTPWTVMMVVKRIFSTTETNIALTDNFIFLFFDYAFAVLYIFGSGLMAILTIVALSYQYAHSAEKLDGISIDEDIENFEEVGDKPEDTHQPVIIRDNREDASRFMPHSDIDNFENL